MQRDVSEKLELELNNTIHWESTYNKMILKQGFKKEDRELLIKLKDFYKEEIITELITGTYKWSTPRKVEIAKHESNKKRIVYIYSTKDRYILGVLYRAISTYYGNIISNYCFSYKKSVSTANAIEYIKHQRHTDYKYGVKLDIHAYFNSVNKARIIEVINELFAGGIKVTIENLMLNDKVQWKGNIISEYKSLIPGCAMGSFFANYCLVECDRYFDNEDCIYARYSDDIIILSNSKYKLYTYMSIIKKYLQQYGLEINPDKYEWFEPGNSIEYLGLKLDDNGTIDISNHSKQKIKKQIHRWCRKARMSIERDNKEFSNVARKVIRNLNNKNFFCAIHNDSTFGWALYSFPRITTVETLKEIDLYTKDCIRALKTGKHNKANYKALTEEELHRLGWLSLVEMYYLYKRDYDYFMEVVELHGNIT